jgi:hypothetical protein
VQAGHGVPGRCGWADVGVARTGREQKSAHPPGIGGVLGICVAHRALRHAPPANRGGAHDLCRPAGPHARTPCESRGWAGFGPLRAADVRAVVIAGEGSRSDRHAAGSPDTTGGVGHISDRFACKSNQSTAQKVRSGCSTNWWLGNDPTAENEPSVGMSYSLISGGSAHTACRVPVWLFHVRVHVHVDVCEPVLDRVGTAGSAVRAGDAAGAA